jgi:ethanolamine kinase
MSTTIHEDAAVGRIDSPIGALYSIPYIPLYYDNEDPDASALKLVQAYAPEQWKDTNGEIKFKRFTEGITNCLTKATIECPGLTASEVDRNAILIRAYGKGTDVLIDRQRELNSHTLLASRGLAPSLLARFENGLMYKYVEGDVCLPEDLRKAEVYQQVAKRLGEWHGGLPITAISSFPQMNGKTPGQKSSQATDKQPTPTPNTWTVVTQWIDALPSDTPEQAKKQADLRTEFESIVAKFSDVPGLFNKSYVFSHCDLLSGNVIVQRPTGEAKSSCTTYPVAFIDYEYTTPSPAAFDIANHFAEWAGFECNHAAVPTKSQRRDFLHHYVASFYDHVITENDNISVEIDLRAAIDQLYEQVDSFRGVPGFYWGVWSLIQATISQIDFDYASYAEIRLGEYWAWKAEVDGSRAAKGEEMPLRERRWAEE